MKRTLAHLLRSLLAYGLLCGNAAWAAQGALADSGKSKPAHSAAGAVSAPQSVPEAGFIVLFGSALVALSAKARRGRQPS